MPLGKLVQLPVKICAYIGYMIEQELGNLLPFEVPFATLMTMVEVDGNDPAFKDPTKFVGPIYTKAEADRQARIKSYQHQFGAVTELAADQQKRLDAVEALIQGGKRLEAQLAQAQAAYDHRKKDETLQADSLVQAKPASVIVKLNQAAPTLEKVTVTAKWEQELKKIGFTDRKKSGLGRYQTREEIESHLPQNITDVFATTPGLTVDYTSGENPTLKSSRSAGGGCVTYFVDGIPYKEQSPGDINDYMRPTEIEATEVYNSEETPGEFQSAGQTSCTTILIWTKTRVADFR